MSSFSLKLLALSCMLCDHLGALFFPGIPALRLIGRAAFPLYAFLLAEGFRHTHSRKRYLFRMALFAVVSEVPYDLCFCGSFFSPAGQNIFFTLTLGLAALWGYERLAVAARRMELGLLSVSIAAVLAQLLRCDYGLSGVMMIFLLYLCREKTRRFALFAVSAGLQALSVAVSSTPSWGLAQLWALAAIVPMALYDGSRGRFQFKWFFYLFYPVHLLALATLSMYFSPI